MEPIEGSEMSAFKTQMLGKYPKENILHKEHGKSLKSRKNNDDINKNILEWCDFLIFWQGILLCFKYTGK